MLFDVIRKDSLESLNVLKVISQLSYNVFYVFIFESFHFLLCGHVYISSERLLSELGPFSLKIIYFSVRHMSHFLVPDLYGLQTLTISHLMFGSSPLSFKAHTKFDNVVLDL